MSIQLQIITPDYVIYDGDVESVTAPGKSGEFQILTNHAPIVSSLVKGKIRIKAEKEANVKHDLLEETGQPNTWELQIDGGVLELENNKLSILPN